MSKTFIVFAFEGKNAISIEKFPEQASDIIRSTVKSLIDKFDAEGVNVTFVSEEDLLKLGLPQLVRVKQSTDEQVTAEEHAMTFLVKKYGGGISFKRKRFVADMVAQVKETINAVKILGRPDLTYERTVEIVGTNKIVNLHYTRTMYQQIQLAYSFLL
nr:MAG TPA_asm: hypothetical protein [Bacteriophage sp.]